jgi:hypothetical protein
VKIRYGRATVMGSHVHLPLSCARDGKATCIYALSQGTCLCWGLRGPSRLGMRVSIVAYFLLRAIHLPDLLPFAMRWHRTIDQGLFYADAHSTKGERLCCVEVF